MIPSLYISVHPVFGMNIFEASNCATRARVICRHRSYCTVHQGCVYCRQGMRAVSGLRQGGGYCRQGRVVGDTLVLRLDKSCLRDTVTRGAV